MINERFKILVISGATASGKSALALEIAAQKNGVIINADAMQLYPELPILSAQPNAEDLKLAPHFLYSVLKHNENSSVTVWLHLAVEKINQALKQNQLPIVVGGTGLYLSKLIDGINKIPEIEESLKIEIRQICANNDRNELIKILLAWQDNFEEIADLDKQRLGRRLEVLKQTGKNLSWWQNQPNQIFYPLTDFYHLNIELPREKLYQNCNQRLALMFKNGALEEAQELLRLNLAADYGATKTIGFLEIKDYLQGRIDQEQAIEIAAQKTRNYAKRQLTWFRNQFKNKVVIADCANFKL
ncbi:MAG: tRNA (adenosine(37)-N6)-dimethylallyltransferase MiaA [Pseudomonadota bacterium]